MSCKLLIIFIYFSIIKKVFDSSSNIEMLFKRQPSIYNNDYALSNYNIDIYISFQIGNKKETLEKIFLKSDTNEFMILKPDPSISNNKYDAEQSSSSKKIAYLRTYNLKYTSRASIYKDKFFSLLQKTKN